jgi:endonuclease/exonuclease/phosphatase family metal-dependent hydrolase
VRRPLLLAVSVAILAGLFAVPAAEAKSVKLKAMTRNLYLGTDLIPIAAAPDEATLEQRVQTGYNEVKKNDFPTRAKAIAAEAKRNKPDLIGLQEVALWRTGPKDGASKPATKVEIDYLKILTKELKRAGLSYQVAKVQQEMNIEAPSASGRDVRLTMRDAILIRKRKGLKVRKTRSKNYKAKAALPTPTLGTINVKRGWVFADLSLNGKRFRFVDTHLESYGDAARLAQAKELIAKGGPTRVGTPVVLTGDLNSDSKGRGGNAAAAYKAVTGFKFRDTWIKANGKAEGLSCCRAADLTDPSDPYDSRIDYVLTRGKVATRASKLLGSKLSDRISGLWPSDHAGLVSSLTLK